MGACFSKNPSTTQPNPEPGVLNRMNTIYSIGVSTREEKTTEGQLTTKPTIRKEVRKNLEEDFEKIAKDDKIVTCPPRKLDNQQPQTTIL